MEIKKLISHKKQNILLTKGTKYVILFFVVSPSGGTGRRTGLKILRPLKVVPVRFRSRAPKKVVSLI